MHRVLVDEKQWIDEQRFLHALNFCIFCPAPRRSSSRLTSAGCSTGCAAGWSLGGLFVLPGMIAIMGLSWLYC